MSFFVFPTLISKRPRLMDYCLLSVRSGRLQGQSNKSTKLSGNQIRQAGLPPQLFTDAPLYFPAPCSNARWGSRGGVCPLTSHCIASLGATPGQW